MSEQPSASEAGSPGETADTTTGEEAPGETADTERYVWGGGIAAGLSLFVPVVPAPVVAYCVWQIRDEKPVSAILMMTLYLATVFFWFMAFIVRG